MNIRLSKEPGFSALSLVAALAVLGLVWVAYNNLRLGGEDAVASQTRVATQEVACRTNRQVLETSITTWSISHPGEDPTFQALEESGVIILGCPEGGLWSLENRRVNCSKHP